MASRRNDSDTRAAILKAAIEIMRDEGYAALSSRRIAERAGLGKSKLVHYHFESMEDLYLTVYRAAEEQYYDRQAKALLSGNPVRALWELNADSYNARVLQELIALASHHESLRREIARSSQRSRQAQAFAFEKTMKAFPAKLPSLSPEFLSLLMTAAARLIAMDRVLGVTAGHAEARTWISEVLGQLEQP
jgi:TetR/AcrR family transcriptional regulator